MIALVAHDSKKLQMREFVAAHEDYFQYHFLVATDHTADVLPPGLAHRTERVGHGPAGGDVVIGSHIVRGQVDAVFFFRDPLSAHPHEHDVSALLRLCDVHNVPLATNLASAELLVRSLKGN